MAAYRGQYEVLNAIPGASASLRWFGWVGIGLLVIPAAALAMLAEMGSTLAQVGAVVLWLPAAGLCALAGASVLLVWTLGSLRRLAELTQALCDQDGCLVFMKDPAQRYRFVNEAAALLIGRRPADVLGRRDRELEPGAEALAWEENDRVCLDRDLPTMFREVRKTQDGERSFLVAKRPLHDTRGRTAGLIGIARDISDELELQKLARRRAEEMRVWFDLNPLPVVIFASAGSRILNANAAAERCYGYDKARFRRLSVRDLFAPSEAVRLEAYLRDAGRPIPPGSVAWQHRRASGEPFDVLADIGNLPRAEVPSRMLLVRDQSARHAAQRALESCVARYEDLLESDPAMIWTHDPDGRLTRVNASVARALGYERGDLLGRPLTDFIVDAARPGAEDRAEASRGLSHDAGILHLVSRSGERRVWQYQLIRYPDAEPAPYVLGIAQDVTLRHRYELRMHEQNRRDPLTGCRTRGFLDLFAMQATNDQVWGCVVLDIDYFRQLNASEGRERGDEVLRDMARMLGNAVASGDVVVRMGGDEFAIVMPHATENSVRELTRRLDASSRDGMPAVFSSGRAVREAGEPLESTLRRADKMLFRTRAIRDGGGAAPSPERSPDGA